jgi:phosphate transport system permease protein
VWPLLSATFTTAAIALVVAVPLGLLAAIYLSEYAGPRTRRIVKPALELLAGVPTIVFGYFAITVLTPSLKGWIPDLAGGNLLSAGIMMGVMIVPLVASLSEDAIYAVPSSCARPRPAWAAARSRSSAAWWCRRRGRASPPRSPWRRRARSARP